MTLSLGFKVVPVFRIYFIINKNKNKVQTDGPSKCGVIGTLIKKIFCSTFGKLDQTFS